MSEDRALHLPAEAVARARADAERVLSRDELEAMLAVRWSAEEEEEARGLIAWFTKRYPTPAARLAKARRTYDEWVRTAPPAALEADRKAREERASRPVTGDP